MTGRRGQGESEVDGVELPAELRDLGVIVEPLGVAMEEYPHLVEPHLGRIADSSGHRSEPADTGATARPRGTFIHVPAGVEVAVPIQATSRARVAALGRNERTLLVAGEGSTVHYIEGCSAPIYTPDPTRSTVTEVVVGPGARVTHTAIQNWSDNVTNRTVKGATVAADGNLEWIDGNMGSRRTSASPTTRLIGPRAAVVLRSVTLADAGQHHRIGATMIHAAPDTTSAVEAKVIADNGGVCHHHGLVDVAPAASGARSDFDCEVLALDDRSEVDTSLDRRIEADDVSIEERTSSVVLDDDRLFYLASRGLSTAQARALVATGFIEPVTRRLPLEFAVEWHRLIELHLTGSVG